jgi:hypothetical protein
MENKSVQDQFVADIYDELKHSSSKVYEFFIECDDNPDLTDFDFIIAIEKESMGLCYIVDYWIESKKIRDSNGCCEVYPIHGKPPSSARGMNPPDYDEKMTRKQIEEHLRTTIMKIITDTTYFKLDKYRGCFVNTKDETAMRKMRLAGMINKAFRPHAKPRNVCCVCDEETQTETPCGHHLCIGCWNKLKNLTCPCCREDIQHIHDDDEY